jgi:hypothetical protein
VIRRPLGVKTALWVAPRVNECVGMRNMRRTVDEWSGVEWSREEGVVAFRDDYPTTSGSFPWTSPQLFHQPNHRDQQQIKSANYNLTPQTINPTSKPPSVSISHSVLSSAPTRSSISALPPAFQTSNRCPILPQLHHRTLQIYPWMSANPLMPI